jgi:ferredoxin--NADP+ reductase
VVDASGFDALLSERGIGIVDLTSWKRLDEHERAAGVEAGRPRVKVVSREQQIKIGAGG